MQWLALVPFMVAAVALVIIPGLLIGAAARLRGWTLAAMAPVLSVTAIAVCAVFAGALHISWSIWPLLGFTAVAALGLVIIDQIRVRVLRTKRFESLQMPAVTAKGPKQTAHNRIMTMGACAVPVVVVAVIATWQFVRMVGNPTSFSDGYDNVFHLNVVRWILDTHNASSFWVSSVSNNGVASGFYPAAWHGLVSQIALLLGSSNVPAAYNAAFWVGMAVVWPLGFVYLVRVFAPTIGPAIQVCLGVIASTMVAITGSFMSNLFPYWLGLMLLAPVLALCVQILGFGETTLDTPLSMSILVIVISVVGLALAHPSTVLSLIAFLSPVGLIWAWRGYTSLRDSNRLRARLYLWGAGVGLLVFMAVWMFARTHDHRDPVNTVATSLGQILLVSPLRGEPSWLLGVLLVFGAIAMVKRPAWRWWWGPTAVAVFLWFMVSAAPQSKFRTILLSGYYGFSSRIAGVLGLVLLVIVALGSIYVWQIISQRMTQSLRWNKAWVRWSAAVLSWLVLFAGTQLIGPMPAAISGVASHYHITPDSPMVDSDEYALMQQLPALVPEGVRVANNPWNGSALAYGLFGVLVTMPDEQSPNTPGLYVLRDHLNTAASQPALVCPALQELNVGFVLDFGDQSFTTWPQSYPGFENLTSSPGFTPVASSGHAVLYRIDACQ